MAVGQRTGNALSNAPHTRHQRLTAAHVVWLTPRVPSIADNIRSIQDRIAHAAERAGRKADDVLLLAISKTFPPAAVREAFDAGLRWFGENKVQEAKAK